MQLRPYQQEAIDAVYSHLRTRTDNPCVVLPTGSGKTPVLATICRDVATRWRGRALILAHVKELLQQAADKLGKIAPDVPFGVYSAGLNSRDTKEPVIIAGIQSVAEKACTLGKFDLIIVDECHLIPPSGEGRYQTFLREAKVINPNVRVIGLTATPYRMGSGMICDPEHILNHVCYTKPIKELIREGYLCKVHTKSPANEIDCSKLHIRNGEFVASEVAELFDSEAATEEICNDIVTKTTGRNAVLVFGSSVEQAHNIQRKLASITGSEIGMITGNTAPQERAELINRFRGDKTRLTNIAEPLRWLVNVNVLTTGFDAPNVDCIAIVRPTASPGLYYQMVGRGFRICEGKSDCLVLDYGSNIQRHGPVDAITIKTSGGGGTAPVRKCPDCGEVMAASLSRCADCGYVFPISEQPSKLEVASSCDGVISGQKTETTYQVRNMYYWEHTKKGASEDAPKTLKVDYEVGFNQFVTVWMCPEHTGFARQKFVDWWQLRSELKPPLSASTAKRFADEGFLRIPSKITVTETAGSRFPDIVEHDFCEPDEIIDVEYTINPDTCLTCKGWNYGWCDLHRMSRLPSDIACEYYVSNKPNQDDIPF